LSAIVQSLTIKRLALFFEHRKGIEFIGSDFVQGDANTQLQCRPEIERTPQQQARLGGLRRVQLVQRAVVAAAAIVGRVWA